MKNHKMIISMYYFKFKSENTNTDICEIEIKIFHSDFMKHLLNVYYNYYYYY